MYSRVNQLSIIYDVTGDLEDLDLYFAMDEERLGRIVTVPLLPGGTAKQVTSENKILYVHLVADYRLNKYTLSEMRTANR